MKAGRWIMRMGATGAVVFLLGEAGARWVLGLGDPPLFVSDEEIKYMYAPSQDCERRHNRFMTNAYSMRSEEFGGGKASAEEYRVLMIGDSIINGGVFLDQREIVSEVIKRELEERLKRPVVVGNASAGGWGTPNELAYVKRYGLFDADCIVIVVSSEDWEDFGQYVEGSAEFPVRKPRLALGEVFGRYLPRYLGMGAGRAEPAVQPTKEQTERALKAFDELVGLCTGSGARVIVGMHMVKGEADRGRFDPGHDELKAIAEGRSVEVVELGEAFGRSLSAGSEPYRDDAHPSAEGTRVMAEALLAEIVKDTRSRRSRGGTEADFFD